MMAEKKAEEMNKKHVKKSKKLGILLQKGVGCNE